MLIALVHHATERCHNTQVYAGEAEERVGAPDRFRHRLPLRGLGDVSPACPSTPPGQFDFKD